jgi:hypothetical protein
METLYYTLVLHGSWYRLELENATGAMVLFPGVQTDKGQDIVRMDFPRKAQAVKYIENLRTMYAGNIVAR